MRYIKVILVGIVFVLALVGCSTFYSDVDIGVTVYEIEDDELIVTSVKAKDKNNSVEAMKQKISEKLREHHEEHVHLEHVQDFGDRMSITLVYDSIKDYKRIATMKYGEDKTLEHDTVEDYLDNQNISYDEFEDKDQLVSVRDKKDISEAQIKRSEDERIIRIECGPSQVIVDGDILFASPEGTLLSKDKIFFDKPGTYYVLYKPSSGISRWILWILLLSIVLYASFIGIKRRSKKEDKICQACQQKNDEDAVYCKICGKLLEVDKN